MKKLFVVALLAISCSSARTEVVVVVTNLDLAAAAGPFVKIKVHNTTHPRTYESVPIRLVPGDPPISLILYPGSSLQDQIVVRVDSFTDETATLPLTSDVAQFTFSNGKSERLDFTLYAACAGNTLCAASNCMTACDPTIGKALSCGDCRVLSPVEIHGEPELGAAVADLSNLNDMSMTSDLSSSDLSMQTDLAMADLPMNDLSQPDLSTPNLPDLATTPPPDLSMRDMVGSAPCGQSNHKCVFVTSLSYTGAFGNLGIADGRCQSAAGAVPSLGSANFKAWLSSSTCAVKDGCRSFTQSTVPYWLVNGTPVAASFSGLSSTLLRAINVSENGAVNSVDVWTNTTNTGAGAGGPDCNDWTSEFADMGNSGSYGVSANTDPTWSSSGSSDLCSTPRNLYCFEQ